MALDDLFSGKSRIVKSSEWMRPSLFFFCILFIKKSVAAHFYRTELLRKRDHAVITPKKVIGPKDKASADIIDINHFCTPESPAQTKTDRKFLSKAQCIDIPFEGQMLKGYIWGEGRTVLLVHGWSSRASHLGFLARNLAKQGFRVAAFDAPAHAHSVIQGKEPRTNLPEFCRAIYHVAHFLGDVYGLIGHSFGGMAAAFTAAGQANLAGYRLEVEKLVMICPPSGIDRLISYYCQNHGLKKGAEIKLRELLEAEFPFRVEDFNVHDALKNISCDVLVVHDQDDQEVAIEDVFPMINGHKHVKLVQTEGEGHRMILASRILLKAINEFMHVSSKGIEKNCQGGNINCSN